MATSPRHAWFGLAAAAMVALYSPVMAQPNEERPTDGATPPHAEAAPKSEGSGKKTQARRDEKKRPAPAPRPPAKRPPAEHRAREKRAQKAEDEAIIRQLEFFLLLEMLRDYEVLTEDPE